MRGRYLEAMVRIEPTGGIVERMHQQCPDSGVAGYGDDPLDGILEK